MLAAKTEKDSILEVKNDMQPLPTHSVVLNFSSPAIPYLFCYHLGRLTEEHWINKKIHLVFLLHFSSRKYISDRISV